MRTLFIVGWEVWGDMQKGAGEGVTDNGSHFVSVNTSMSYWTERHNDSLIDLIIKKSNIQEYILVGSASLSGKYPINQVNGRWRSYPLLVFFFLLLHLFILDIFILDITNSIRFFINGPIVEEQQKNYLLLFPRDFFTVLDFLHLPPPLFFYFLFPRNWSLSLNGCKLNTIEYV